MASRKGSENKKSWNAQELARELGIDPLKILLDFAQNAKDEKDRIKAASEACKYLYSTQKAVEFTGEPAPFKVIIEDYKG
jgi:hypothetical protein